MSEITQLKYTVIGFASVSQIRLGLVGAEQGCIQPEGRMK